MISDANHRPPAIEQSEQSNNLALVLKSWPLIALLTIGLCYLTQLVAGWFGVELKEQSTVEQMRTLGVYTWKALNEWPLSKSLTDRNVLAFLFNIPVILLVMPAIEEFIFRFLLFKLPARYAKPAVFAVTASILFSAAHYLQAPWPNNAFLALFFFGLAQCWLYRKTERIWCPILNHGLFNLTNLVLLFVVPA